MIPALDMKFMPDVRTAWESHPISYVCVCVCGGCVWRLCREHILAVNGNVSAFYALAPDENPSARNKTE